MAFGNKMMAVFLTAMTVGMGTIVYAWQENSLQAAVKEDKYANPAPVTITFAGWGIPEERRFIGSALHRFMETHPHIRVHYEPITADYQKRMMDLASNNNLPDVLCVGAEDLPFWAQKGIIQSLTPFVSDHQVSIRDIYPPLLSLVSMHGQLYGIPKDWSPLVLYYNKALFDHAHVSYPKQNWTMETFVKTAKALTVNEAKKGTSKWGLALGAWWGQWAPFVWSEGGDFINTDGTKATFENDTTLKGLRLYNDLLNTYKVSPSPEQLKQLEEQPIQLFESGRAAMMLSGRWVVPQLRASSVHFDVAEFPIGKTRFVPAFTASYSMSAGTDHPNEAWELIKYLSGQTESVLMARTGAVVPAEQTIARNRSMYGTPPDNSEAYDHAANYIKCPTQVYGAKWEQFNTIVASELIQMANKRQSVEETAKKLDSRLNEQMFK